MKRARLIRIPQIRAPQDGMHQRKRIDFTDLLKIPHTRLCATAVTVELQYNWPTTIPPTAAAASLA